MSAFEKETIILGVCKCRMSVSPGIQIQQGWTQINNGFNMSHQ